jgi:integrase
MKDNRLSRAVSLYLGEMRERGLCKSYTDRSGNILRGFAEYSVSKGATSPSSVDITILRDFLSMFADKSASYQGFVFAIVKCFLRFADNPLGWKYKHRIIGRGRKVRWLTPEEVDVVLSSEMTPREALIVTCHFLAGMRRCEVRRLLVWDIQEGLRTGQMTITGKNAKQRPVWIHPDMKMAFEAFLKTTDKGQNERAIPLCDSSYTRLIQEVSTRTGIPFRSHDGRRTFLQILRLLGNPLEVVSEIAGHSDVRITQRYLNVSMDRMKIAVESYHPKVRVQIALRPVV